MCAKVLRLYNRIKNPVEYLYCTDLTNMNARKVGEFNTWKRIKDVANLHPNYETFPKNKVFVIKRLSDYPEELCENYRHLSTTNTVYATKSTIGKNPKLWKSITGNENLINNVRTGDFTIDELISLLKIISIKMSSK